MKYKNFLYTVLLAGATMASNAAHAWDLAIAAGRTGQSQTTLRVGASQQWQTRWWETSTGHLSGYWDVGLTYWQSGKYDKNVYTLSISPVFTYNFQRAGTWQPFVEAGIGASAFSRTKVGDKRLGSSLNFEDRLGVGVVSGSHRFGFRVIHYSNAGIRKPNEGIESYNLYYAFKF